MSDMDYGLVAKALAAAAGLKAIKGKIKAEQLNRYADFLNSTLPSGYQLPYQKQNFVFGDAKAFQDAMDDAAKRQLEQYTSDYYAKHAGIPQGPLQAVKDVYNSEIAPTRTENVKRQLEGKYGLLELQGLPATLDWVSAMSGQGPAVGGGPAPVKPSSLPYVPKLQEDPAIQKSVSSQGSPLQGSIQYNRMQNLPEYITPETLRAAMSFYNTQRGQNVTMRGQDLNRQTDIERLDEQKRINSARMQYMADRLGIDRKRLDLYAKALKMRLGRAPTKVEIARELYRQGRVPEERYLRFIFDEPELLAPPMLPNAGGFGVSPARGIGIPSFSEWDSGGE